MKRFRTILFVLVFASALHIPTYAANTSSYETALEKENIANQKIVPSDKYNIVLKINKETKEEEYTYYERDTGTATTFVVKDGEIIQKTVADESLHPYSLLYKEGSSVVPPSLENVYFSYVTLPNTVDYIFQLDTGKLSAMNCAPTSIAMAYNWTSDLDKDNGLTAAWIRSTYPSDEGELDDSDYETGYTIKQKAEIYRDLGLDIYESTSYTDSETLVKWLNEGCLLNLAVNSADLDYDLDKFSRIDKSYKAGAGHSILCTGYLYMLVEDPETGVVREQLYFEIIDPAEGVNNSVRYYTKESLDKMLRKNYCRYIAIKHTK